MDEISTGISRRGSVLGGVTAGVAAMAAGGLDTSIVGLIRGYACRRGFQLFMSCSYRLDCIRGNSSLLREFRAAQFVREHISENMRATFRSPIPPLKLSK